MSSFKNKIKKIKKTVQQTITLDNKHKQIVDKFDQERNNLQNYYNELDKFRNNLSDINIKITNNLPDDNLNKQRNTIKEKIKNIENKIRDIEGSNEELEYYSQTINILDTYYTNRSNEKNMEENEIITFLTNKVHKDRKNKAVLLDEYNKVVDKVINGTNKKLLLCNNCNIEKIVNINDGTYICTRCGEVSNILYEIEKPNYKNVNDENNIQDNPYKRINHFNEWLVQIQGRETTDINNEVYQSIINEIKKNKELSNDLSLLTNKQLKKILRKLNLNKYYEHIPFIINKLNSLPPPNISREHEEKFRSMFKEIQEPFTLYCPKDRKNFLSYSYVLHKFCELLELDELIVFFPLLKSRQKLKEHDYIWKKICQFLKWEFIDSV
jgi:hypothetical protein